MDEKDCLVGIGQYKVGRNSDKFIVYGLGSCVGVTLYDSKKKVGGLAHIMLPSSRYYSNPNARSKYADTAIHDLLGEVGRLGAEKTGLEAKLVGGANMFSTLFSQAVPVGIRNVMAVREKLQEFGIRVVAEDVGGVQGRTIVFSLGDGRIQIKKLNQPEKWI